MFRFDAGGNAVGREVNSERERFWRDVVRRRAESGMTIEDFCRSEGLKPTTYQYWRQQIRRRDSERPSTGPSTVMPALTAVQVVDDHATTAVTGVEVVAKNGYRIRIGEQATSEQLRLVLQLVSELG